MKNAYFQAINEKMKLLFMSKGKFNFCFKKSLNIGDVEININIVLKSTHGRTDGQIKTYDFKKLCLQKYHVKYLNLAV